MTGHMLSLLLGAVWYELYYTEQEKKECPKLYSKDYWFNERSKDDIVKGWLARELWDCAVDIVKKGREAKSDKSVYIE